MKDGISKKLVNLRDYVYFSVSPMNTQPHQSVFRAAPPQNAMESPMNEVVPVASRSGIRAAAHMFLTGFIRLVTAQFNRRNAVCLVALSVPALLVTALLTLPAFLFNTPQHNEYFEFAQQLNRGGDRWFAMGLSACCCLFCFAVPCDHSRNITRKGKA